jgi:GMP synthase-like glutamine amidotransferase
VTSERSGGPRGRATDKIGQAAGFELPVPNAQAAMRPVAIFRYSPTEGPGRFGEWLSEQAIPWEIIAIDEGAAVPADPDAYAGIGMMGGPMSVYEPLPWIAPMCSFLRDAIGDGVPVIGHCLGAQLMAKALGARVQRAQTPEIGWLHVDVCDRGARREWFGGLPRFAAFHWHYDTFDLPPMATRVLTNAANPDQGFIIDDRHVGLQCHVEMTRELVESWCRTGAAELPARSSAHVQTAFDMLADLPARLAALTEVADNVYSRWAQGLKR